MFEFRDLVAYPGYRVDSDGNVWSCRKKGGVGKSGRGSGIIFTDHWFVLSPRVRPCGHLHVVLTNRDGARDTRLSHHLILEAFIGPRPDGMECRHLNGSPSDNRLENIRWDTRTANVADRIAHGGGNKGARHGMAKLTEDQVRAIRAEYGDGKNTSCRIIGLKFGVSQNAVHRIVTRKYWSHVE